MTTLSSPVCSVVTVTFNNAAELEKTILSVINQDYSNYEFIIIDGGSTDSTMEVITKYSENIDHWVSEDDAGIYDAMNKGIGFSKGKWLNFMNAGDIYINESVLSKTFIDFNSYNEYSFLLGNTIIKYDEMQKRFRGDINQIKYGTQFIHQSTFISRKYHLKNFYDTDESIAADYKFFYSAIHNKEPYFELNQDICLFASGGISDTKRIKSLIGGLRISLMIAFDIKVIVIYLFNIFKSVFKLIVKSILPLKIIKNLRVILHKARFKS